MQADDLADDDHAGRAHRMPAREVGQGLQGRDIDFLSAGGALLHDGRGRGLCQAVPDQFPAQDINAVRAHIHREGLLRLGQGRPVQVHRAVLDMARDEQAGLGIIAVGQRDAGIRRATARGRHAGHDLKRDIMRREQLDLLAAAPEDKRIATLQAQHAPALPGQLHQQLIDLPLRQRVLIARLANIDALGVFMRELDDPGRDQAIIEHHIGLLHQTQGPEGQQVRVTRPAPHQIDLAGPAVVAGGPGQLAFQQLHGLPVPPGEQHLGHGALQCGLPKAAPLSNLRKASLDPLPEARDQARQPPVAGGDQGLQAGPQQPRQHGRGPAC